MVEEAGKVAATPVATPVADQSGQIGDLLSEYTPTEPAPVVEGAPVEGGEAPVVEAPIVKEGEEPPVVDEKDQLITTLQTQMAEISAKLEAITGKVEKPIEEAKPAEFKGNFYDSKEEYDKSFEDQETQNKVLSRVVAVTAQQILTNLPKVVSNIVKSQVEVSTKVNSFFADNKDLLAHRQFVGFVSNDLQGKNPSWTLDKLFGELGKEVRTRIGLAQTTKTPLPGKGGFPPTKGGGARLPGKKTETLTSLEKEIDDLIK